jgi:predicted AAA+ superfamily ATPase
VLSWAAYFFGSLKSEKMSEANRHIEKYLCEYLGLEFSPGFAVLLQGEWGCGKTWFIKRFIEEYEKNKGIEGTKRVLYVSLYAVKSTNEIEDQIFQQLHPVLSSKPMALTGKILKGVLRASTI